MNPAYRQVEQPMFCELQPLGAAWQVFLVQVTVVQVAASVSTQLTSHAHELPHRTLAQDLGPVQFTVQGQ